MTAPVLDKKKHVEGAWFPDGWETEWNIPCELLVSKFTVSCDEPAEVAYRYACCGFVKRVCLKCWEYLNSPGGVTRTKALQCIGCKHNWGDFKAAVSHHWKI